MDREKLVELALEAREKSYAPYSHFHVGAALLGKNGTVYQGCNIENASYGVSNCAERTAFFQAISKGQYEFEAIAIVGGKEGSKELPFCAPCGVCRQVMMEFCNPKEFKIILSDGIGNFKEYMLEELMYMGFGPDNL